MIKVIKGDITKEKTDAIVNAANNGLLGGGGVDGAIHKAGGPEISLECSKIRERQGGCKTGEAVITKAGNLPCKYVIHTVGPVWRGGKDNETCLLKNCYENCLKLAAEYGVKTISFSNISTGVYGFPKKEAAEIAVSTALNFVKSCKAVDEIHFVCFDEENYKIYSILIDKSI